MRGLGGVGAAGVAAGLHGKPKFDQFAIGGTIVGGSEAGRSHYDELVHKLTRQRGPGRPQLVRCRQSPAMLPPCFVFLDQPGSAKLGLSLTLLAATRILGSWESMERRPGYGRNRTVLLSGVG